MIKKEEVQLFKQLVQSNQIVYLDIATVLSGRHNIKNKCGKPCNKKSSL